MRANEFVKKFGWDVAKHKADELKIIENMGDKLSIEDNTLIRLVESWDLVELCGGLEVAKNLDTTLLTGWVESVDKAILDVEACQ